MYYSETTIYLYKEGHKYAALALPCKPSKREIALADKYASFVRGNARIHVLAPANVHQKSLLWWAQKYMEGMFTRTPIDSLR